MKTILCNVEEKEALIVGSDDVSALLSETGDSFNSTDFFRTEGRLFLVPCSSPFLLVFKAHPVKFIVREPEGRLLLTFGGVDGRARYGMPTGVFAFVDPGLIVEKAG
jgi:hypothetical protein